VKQKPKTKKQDESTPRPVIGTPGNVPAPNQHPTSASSVKGSMRQEIAKNVRSSADPAAVAVKKTREQLEYEAMLSMLKVTGTHRAAAAEWILNGAANARVWPRLKQEDAICRSVAAMAEMAPQNAMEAMLAVQTIAANDAALMFLSRATLENQSSEVIDVNVLRATRLMRVFNEQLEAMQKLKGKSGQQRVTVEHVHVHQGGQAIVGSVTAAQEPNVRGHVDETQEKNP
jgi:hypothetical protein